MELSDDRLKRLETSIENRDWDLLLSILKPKCFPRDETGKLANPLAIAKIAETLTTPSLNVPDKVKIVFLKCLMNSCVNGYLHKEYNAEILNTTSECSFYTILYKNYAQVSNTISTDKHRYPIFTHFPYEGAAEWAVDYVSEFFLDEKNNQSDDKLEILRLNVQFLCNLSKSIFSCTRNEQFKKVVTSLVQYDHLPVSRAACAFIYNALTLFKEDYYTEREKNEITMSLMKPVKMGILSAIDALKFLLKNPQRLRNVYEEFLIEDRLYLLEILHQDLLESDSDLDLSPETISFLSQCFKRKSDLVLKTVNTYLNGTEPTEIMILLDILGVLTSRTSEDKNFSSDIQEDRSLLINCIYLLKSLHMVGRESDNFFTPVQNLSKLAPAGQNSSNDLEDIGDIQSHPAFGFKAGLIRVIGNMVHKHKANQDLLRDVDGIPLLLDCCNMDARNPLIMQWTILAMRNICENNLSNQEVVRGLTKIGIADNSVIREMGITLHDEGDGKAVGIVPLNKNGT